MTYDKLVLATGSLPNKFGWEGENLKGVQGLVTKQDLELLEENTKCCKSAVIIGGGLIGVELAEMLRTRDIKVTFLVRESGFWSSVLPKSDAELISAHIISHGVDLIHESELDKILSDKDGRVRAVKTTSGKEIECQLVGLSVGVHPNIAFLKTLPWKPKTESWLIAIFRLISPMYTQLVTACSSEKPLGTGNLLRPFGIQVE